jgi:nicotinate phosphoribosyltransferase
MKERLELLVDLYELTMAECYFQDKIEATATFELFVRQLPGNRSFLMSAGLEDLLSFVRDLRFTPSDLKYLAGLKLFSRGFLKYLKDFKFTGDIWSMDEATVFFANEPLVRVTAPIIQAQLLEGFFLNTINLQTMIASKASRVVLSAKGRAVHDFSLRRAQGSDAGLKVARSAYIAGFSGTSNVLAGKSYGVPLSGTMAHSFVMAYESEIKSFQSYCRVFPSRAILLVDTYDTRAGLANAIKAGLELKKRGYALAGIRLDSGDIVSLSRLARKMLDKAGLKSTRVFASGNLDEFGIERIIKKGGRVDSFGVGTRMGTSSDAPWLDVNYKLSEITDKRGDFLPTMKLSRDKVTYPGRKQVFRVKDGNNRFIKDIVALENEKIKGIPLLKPVILGGKRVAGFELLDDIRKRGRSELAGLPLALKTNKAPKRAYPVLISPELQELTDALFLKINRETQDA